jgi:hypothetical protein
MRPDFIEQLQYRLLELGCPGNQMKRLAGEIADHQADLKQAALAEGLSEAEAEVRANAQLGDPLYLAEQKMIMLRRSSWWGRHFFIGFCLLPLLTVPFLWALLLLFNLSLEFALGYGWDTQKLHVATDNPVLFHRMVMAVHGADYLAITLMTLLFCWLARRSVVSLAWRVSACVICSLYALFLSVHIRPHLISVAFSWTPHWIRAVIPLLIVGAIYIYQRRMSRVVWRMKAMV